MIDRLIRGKIIEIIVVIVFVFLSIPVWQSFDKKISKANIVTADDCNLEFNLKNNGTKDILTISNTHHINKKYKVYLEINKAIDTTDCEIIINGETYKLNDFYKESKKNSNVYTIINNYITYLSSEYIVELKLNSKTAYYTYSFEESINF